MSSGDSGIAGTARKSPVESARSGQYMTLKADVQPLARSPTTMLGRSTIQGSSSASARIICSDSNFDCS